jgi:glycosyltransferase involved in cell wall biosynthesis
MKVSVAVCTWNRADLLDQTLTRMRGLRIPQGVEWDLVVVNNNCTDHTDVVIARHQNCLPILRLFEPKQGHSNARNRAIDAANGELIVWSDDDVLVDPEWLASYVSAARRWPEAGYFGGAITPWYECDPPAWVLPNLARLEGLLVIRDFGPNERNFSPSEQPWGANMAFRLAVMRRFRFDPNLGRNGDDGILGDETALFKTLRNEGVRGVWIPSASVKHFAPRARLTRKYLWDYFHGVGRTELRMNGFTNTGKCWNGAPRWLYRQALEKGAHSFFQRLWSRSAWVPAYTQAAWYSGMIAELRHQSRARASVRNSPTRDEG